MDTIQLLKKWLLVNMHRETRQMYVYIYVYIIQVYIYICNICRSFMDALKMKERKRERERERERDNYDV